MKKITVILLAAIMLCSLALGLTACADKNNNGIEIEPIGTLTVATNAEFEPFEFLEKNGDFTGVDIDLAVEIAKMLNMKLKIVNLPFTSVIAALETKTADIAMAGLTINEEREKSVDFCDPYFDANQVVIAKKGSAIASVKTDAELASALVGKKIGFQGGTVGQYYVEGSADWEFDGIANAVATSFNSGALAVQAMLSGNIDCVVIDKAPAIKLIEKNSDLVALTDYALTDEQYAFAVQEGDAELCELVNACMKILKANGKFDAILAKYFGK